MFERVLVPLDGSELAERALPAALSLIPDGDGEIILLRIPVVTPMSHSKPTGALSWWYPEQALQRATEEARAYLSAICARHARPGARIVMKVIEGDPAAEIVDVAKARKVDAIVMTTHGYSGVTHWVMGSVTEKVVRNAACPVMIVRAKRP